MAQKCSALLGHETKTTTVIWNYCLGSTAAAFLLLGIFFGLIFSYIFSFGFPSLTRDACVGVPLAMMDSKAARSSARLQSRRATQQHRLLNHQPCSITPSQNLL